MKICVLQSDYSLSNVNYKHYDPQRNLQKLRPDDTVHHVFLNKLTTYRQLKELKKENYDIFVNLCEGYLEWEVPSVDVIHSLELLNLPYTGPTADYYDVPKSLMKYVAYCAGVKTPNGVLVNSLAELETVEEQLNFPLFLKPSKIGDSIGVDENSLVDNSKALFQKAQQLLEDFGEILIEEYIAGREFTTLVAANPDGKGCTVFKPVEYVFPENRQFKTYAMKTSELHTNTNIPCSDSAIEKELREATEQLFMNAEAMGYGRLDFRVNDKNEIFFLEMNLTCSVFYEDGYEGSADYILNNDPAGKTGFLNQIIEEGITRHRKKQKKYTQKGNSISGYGIFANCEILQNEVIFRGEEKAQRLVSKGFVNKNWNKRQKENFKHYAYPVGNQVYIYWDENPMNWAPQNHSCDPNTAFDGLNMIAKRKIAKNEELTLDYATFLDENIEPFKCNCGSNNCRGMVSGLLKKELQLI